MSALSPLVDPPPVPHLGGTSGLQGGMPVAMSDPQAVTPPQSLVPANMQLSRNPMLPAHPLGAYTDSQYEASDAILRNQVAKQYADLLQQLGYRDEAGNFIMGSVESEAQKQQAALAHSQTLAAQGVTDQAQREGTLFSGMRGTLQARAEDPFVRQTADLTAATPLTIQHLYEQASGLTNDYVLGQNQNLAAAAQRAAQNLTLNPPTTAAPAGDGGAVPPPGVTTPDAGASLAPAPGADAWLQPGAVHPITSPGVGMLPPLGAAPPVVLTPQQQAASAVASGIAPRFGAPVVG